MKLIETGSLPITDIQVGERVRPLDEAWAQGLAAMFQQSGMQNAVILMRVDNACWLVAGRHRVRAYEINGWSDIPAKIYEPETGNPMAELELAEIDENLGRNELNILDRAASITRRQAVLKTLHGETRGRPSEKTANFAGISIAGEIAAKLKLSKRTIEAATSMFNGLSSQTRRRVTGTWLADNHVQLRDLSRLDADQQERTLNLMLGDEPKAKRVIDAVCIIEKRPKPQKNSREAQVAKIIKIYTSLDAAGRRQALLLLRDMGVRITGEAVKTGTSRKTREA